MPRPAAPDRPPHGTRRRYQDRLDPCRCERCRRGNADYVAHRRKVRRDLSPVTVEGLPMPGRDEV